jgi:hypothetical protein
MDNCGYAKEFICLFLFLQISRFVIESSPKKNITFAPGNKMNINKNRTSCKLAPIEGGKIMNEIYSIERLAELELFLSGQNADEIREKLFAEFLKYSDYRNVTEWNKAVRLCECLAIIGWGNYEPVQAVRGTFFNGNPDTDFYNKFSQARFVSAVWSKRKNGLTMENGRTAYYYSPDVPNRQTVSEYPIIECIEDLKLADQRNWIPRSPIFFNRTVSNCYENSKVVIESIGNDLQANLNLKMTPEKYGRAINIIKFNLSFSYFDHEHCKKNIIIADEKLNLKHNDFYPVLLTMYSKKEIEKNGYFLRNRYKYGNFRDGVFRVDIHFEKELSEMGHSAQKQKISFHIETALEAVIEKLKKKKPVYNFDLMKEDFLRIINEWKAK